jgi:hypothetical protein
LTRLRLIALVSLVLAIAAGLVLVEVPAIRARRDVAVANPGISSTPGVANIAMQAAPPLPTLRAGQVANPAGLSEFGWALLDRHTSQIVGSANKDTMTNTTESMVKPWLAADYLKSLGTKQPTQQAQDDIANMIEWSNDATADMYYKFDGGPASIQRLINTCGLSGSSSPDSQGWSYTLITPADAVRYGKCLGDSTAAGATETPWLLDKMRHVQGGVNDQISATKQGGHWGIVDGLPDVLAQQVAIKNGWTYIYADHKWHINCLAILPDWVLAVEMQYAPTSANTELQRGADVCASVARQLVYTPDV